MQVARIGRTHPEYSRIIRYSRSLVLLPLLLRRAHDLELLHIAAAEDDVFVDLVLAWDLVGRVAFAAFRAVADNGF